MSQKQLRDSEDDRGAAFNNTRKLEADLSPTSVTTDNVRKQCCNS